MIVTPPKRNKAQGGACHGQALETALKTTRQLWQNRPNLAMSPADEKIAKILQNLGAQINADEASTRLTAVTSMVDRRKVRTCLVCGEKFDSAGPENRRCLRCVRKVAYQHGSRRLEGLATIGAAFQTHKGDE